MNQKQMEMLSVKNAIERTVQGYITTYKDLMVSNATDPSLGLTLFWSDVERYVASLFVSHQIDNNYSVRSDRGGNLEINFTAYQQRSGVTFMLPPGLRYTSQLSQPVQKTLFNDVELSAAWQIKGPANSFEVEYKTKPSTPEKTTQAVDVTDPISAYDAAKKFTERS